VLDGSFDFSGFDRLVETGLYQELPEDDYGKLVRAIESLMVQLRVMPFDESSLPPEDPATF
jgi:hypothetical protein